MGYRDDLEAAQHRIRELEARVQELEAEKNPPPTPEPTPGLPTKGPAFGTVIGLPIFLVVLCVFLGLGTSFCSRACGAINGETEPALAELQKCSKAKELLGDDVGWGTFGCANYEGEGGGDPFNGGCTSSSSWQMPVSGSKGRGTYTFTFSQPAGGKSIFGGGHVTTADGKSFSVSADGSCN